MNNNDYNNMNNTRTTNINRNNMHQTGSVNLNNTRSGMYRTGSININDTRSGMYQTGSVNMNNTRNIKAQYEEQEEKKNHNTAMLIINIFIVISTFVIMILDLVNGAGDGQLGELYGLNLFKAFTIDSNILNALFSMVILVFNIDNLVREKNEIPYWATIVQYVGTCAVTLTLFVVAVFLAPMQFLQGESYFKFFMGDMLFLHLINPVLSIIECQFLNNNFELTFRDSIYGCIPMFLYAGVYTPMVIRGEWSDFYNFTLGGNMFLVPIVLIVIFLVSLLLGTLIRIIHNHIIDDDDMQVR